MFKRLPLGTQVSVFGLLFLAIALTAGLAFVYEAEHTRLNELIHDKALRVLRAFEASHTQAMVHRGDNSDGNAVVNALNGTMEQLSHSQENMKIWVFMGPKVVEFQTDNGRTEIEPPIDAVDRDAIASRKPVGRFVGENTYRLSVPVILGQGPGADPRCAICHEAIMGIKAGEPIGGFAVAYDATADEENFLSFFYRTSLYVGGIICLTTLLLLALVNRLAAWPIREVAQILRRMAAGDETVAIPAPTTAKNSDIAEILQAAAVFDGHARSQMEQLRRALDAHAIVSIADVKGNITFANDLFCQLSGYSREELIGANHRIVKSDHHTPEFYRELWRTIASGKIWHGEIKNQNKSGDYYWVSATITPSLGPDGKP
jgi:PAS domain S-box-containing protein